MARRRRKFLGFLAVLQGENVKKRVQNNVTMNQQIPRKIQNNVTIEKNWPDFNLKGGIYALTVLTVCERRGMMSASVCRVCECLSAVCECLIIQIGALVSARYGV